MSLLSARSNPATSQATSRACDCCSDRGRGAFRWCLSTETCPCPDGRNAPHSGLFPATRSFWRGRSMCFCSLLLPSASLRNLARPFTHRRDGGLAPRSERVAIPRGLGLAGPAAALVRRTDGVEISAGPIVFTKGHGPPCEARQPRISERGACCQKRTRGDRSLNRWCDFGGCGLSAHSKRSCEACRDR